MNKYTFKRKLGIDDLLCEVAFTSNSQGDTSASNEISDYTASKGWMSITSGFEDIANNQEAIYEESKKRYNQNIDYIEKLKSEGKYGEEYEIDISLHPDPSFDTPTNKGGPPLSSYRMIFLDLNENKI
jgi:hypothetical protein